jgi:opacity protein-like surface antigen
MKKLTVVAAGLLLLAPSLAFSDSVSLRLGYFMPRALSNSYFADHGDSLWTIEFENMSFLKKDFRGGTLGISYDYFLGKNVNLSFAFDGYSRSRMGDYLSYDQTEFTDGWYAFPIDQEPADITDWYYISHSFKVSSMPLQASIKFLPLGRKTRLIPYVGGGGGLYFWNVRMYGEMIDFLPVDANGDPVEYFYTDPVLGEIIIYPVVDLNSRESGTAFGWHAFAGVQFPIGYRATIEVEARYHSARARMKDWFEGFEPLELGGLNLVVGLSYWF